MWANTLAIKRIQLRSTGTQFADARIHWLTDFYGRVRERKRARARNFALHCNEHGKRHKLRKVINFFICFFVTKTKTEENKKKEKTIEASFWEEKEKKSKRNDGNERAECASVSARKRCQTCILRENISSAKQTNNDNFMSNGENPFKRHNAVCESNHKTNERKK